MKLLGEICVVILPRSKTKMILNGGGDDDDEGKLARLRDAFIT